MPADAESAFTRTLRPVLLLDARSWNRRTLAEAAPEAGFLGLGCANAARAVALLSKNDLHFLALVLPERPDDATALALVREARAERPGLPIAVVCADATAAARMRRALAEGGFEGTVAVAPETPHALFPALRDLLAQADDTLPSHSDSQPGAASAAR